MFLFVLPYTPQNCPNFLTALEELMCLTASTQKLEGVRHVMTMHIKQHLKLS